MDTFTQLVTEYTPRIHSFMYSHGLRSEDVKDVTQNVFIKLHRNMQTYRGGNLTSWIFQIARNALIDHYRRESKRVFACSEQLDENLESHIASPRTHLQSQDVFCAVDGALSKRSDLERKTFQLFMQGYTHEEIAARTGSNVPVSRSRVYRVRQYLREHLPAHVRYS